MSRPSDQRVRVQFTHEQLTGSIPAGKEIVVQVCQSMKAKAAAMKAVTSMACMARPPGGAPGEDNAATDLDGTPRP